MVWLAATPPATTSAAGRPGDIAEGAQGDARAVGDHVDHRRLEARAQVGDVGPGQRRDPLRLHAQGGLEAGQREVRLRAAEHGPRQVEALRIAAAGLALDLRPARIAEAEELGDLVEGLADGVVDGRAEADVIADAAHRDELRVPAGGEEEQVGETDAVGEARRQGMALEVVDGEQRLAGDERQRLGGGQPDQHAADQPRTGGRGDAVEIGEA